MLTRENSIKIYEEQQWKNLSHREIAILGLSNEYLCVPSGLLQEAVEVFLDRPVFTHEYTDPNRLLMEGLK
jgi:hypothetical protein